METNNDRELQYRVIRYLPNLVRDEWVNIGVLLEEAPRESGAGRETVRREARFIEEPAEFARVRRLHPGADEMLLRSLAADFDARLRASANGGAAEYLRRLEDSLSNAVQFGPRRGVLAADFDAELERLYLAQVSPPRGARGGLLENTRAWIRERLRDVFLRRMKGKSSWQKSIAVEQYTQPGDPLKIDYGYRSNGTTGFIHAISLWRDPGQAKVLAYTAECIRARVPQTEFTAVVELEPARENARHQFVARLFEEQKIAMVPLNRIEKFADDLRVRVN